MSVENRMSGVLDVLRSDVLNAFPYRCAVMRNRNASCTRCAEACTSGAISLQEDQIVVDPALCVGCGTCATVCPTCALEANNPSDAELVAQAGRACANAGDTRPPFRGGCQKSLSATWGRGTSNALGMLLRQPTADSGDGLVKGHDPAKTA